MLASLTLTARWAEMFPMLYQLAGSNDGDFVAF